MLDWLLSVVPWQSDRPLSEGRFRRTVRRHLQGRARRNAALLVVEVDCGMDSRFLLAGRNPRQMLSELMCLVRFVAPEALISVIDSNALIVFLPDLTHGISAAEAIRQAVLRSIDMHDADEDRAHWRPDGDGLSIIGVAVGAVRIGPGDDLSNAVNAAADLVKQAKREGGSCVKWNAVT